MIAFGQLKSEIRQQIWASGEAENLVTQHDFMFLEALAEIQKFIKCEQINNVTVVPFCKTYFKCGMTVVPAPRGVIKRVYTIADDEWCEPVWYTEREWPFPECWSNSIIDVPVPLTAGLARLPMGFNAADESTDVSCGRAMAGAWSKHERNIYIVPWIQSNESVVIEWDGIRDGGDWADQDLLNPATDFRKAVKAYVQWAHERDFGSDAQLKRDLRAAYDEAYGDLMWQCQEETKWRETKGCMNRRCYTTPGQLLTDGITPPAACVQMVFGGMDDPNGSQTAVKFSIYNQTNADGTFFRTWIKTTDGGNTGWE